jgi:uroporphyrinogen-III synthase
MDRDSSIDGLTLAGRRIVITRSEVDNQALSARLSELGATVIPVPLVVVLPPKDEGHALGLAAARLSKYGWVVLTSVNAVTALRAAMGDGDWPAETVAVPVGPVTAEAARACGMRVAEPPPTATAEALVEAFPVHPGIGNRPVLAPLAELAGPAVVDGLTARGYRVDRVTAYRTAGPQGIELDLTVLVSADAVVFFSPSVVDRLVDLMDRQEPGGPVRRPAAICIGPSTAERAAERHFRDVTVAEPHTEDGVVDALCRRFGTDR